MSFNFDFDAKEFKKFFSGFLTYNGMTPLRFVTAVAVFIASPLLMVSTDVGMSIIKNQYWLVVVGNICSAFFGSVVWCPNGLKDMKKKVVYEQLDEATGKWGKKFNTFYGTLIIALIIALVLYTFLTYGYA